MDKVACRTPAEGRDGVTNIPAWKFDAVRGAILDTLADGPIKAMTLKDAVGERLDPETLEKLGKLGWHVVTVKLEMEVRGEIERLDVKGPQQIRAV
ncbi:hypothetical protein [Tateyamaria sp. ANG-S1]|uniref:DUF6958 family protein n=1 Tax=Tateyamaria sp. ANG-S1 TaxID=1577905 RepID=UPI00057F8F06|nr:hypothetical protein [Tateyamaria sp. ANG-S1]KIC50025.1 hypothetical protein RA29_10465 [Tateyamaria sp. ANG-S1]